MSELLISAIIAIAGIFLLLTVIIFINKMLRDGRARWNAYRRMELEPLVRAHARKELFIHQELSGFARWRDRELLETILLEQTQRAEGLEKKRLSEALQRLGYFDGYLRRLKSRGWWTRAEAAEKLGRSGSARAVDPLFESLNDEVAEVRLRAAKALSELGGGTTLQPLIRMLSEPNRWSTMLIADIFAARSAEVVGELKTAYTYMNQHARLATLDILSEIKEPLSAPWLRELLKDHDANIRSRAANALGALKDQAAGAQLTRLLQDPEWSVRAVSAKALGIIGHQHAIPDLCSVLRDPVWWVRANAADALQVLGPAGLEALKTMLDDSDPYARHQAVQMLESTGTLDKEIKGLVHDEADKRAMAGALVVRLIGDGRIGRLRELAERHRDPRLRSKLKGLLIKTKTESFQGVSS